MSNGVKSCFKNVTSAAGRARDVGHRFGRLITFALGVADPGPQGTP